MDLYFDLLGKSSICPAGNQLSVSEKNKIPVSAAFAISRVEQLEQREKHPCLESWIKERITNEQPFMYFPPYLASLTSGISQLLQIAQVGCYGTTCSSSCLKVRSSFQDLMYAVSRGRYTFIITWSRGRRTNLLVLIVLWL